MVAPTDTQIKALLVAQVGEVATTAFPAGLLAGNVDLLWDLYADDATVAPALGRLKVKLGLIDLALGEARKVWSFTSGPHSQTASDGAKRLLEMREETLKEIAVEQGATQGAAGAAIGQLVTVTPQTPPRGPLAPRDGRDHSASPRYSGSPYYPGGIRRPGW
jgi:hypothetical protein